VLGKTNGQYYFYLFWLRPLLNILTKLLILWLTQNKSLLNLQEFFQWKKSNHKQSTRWQHVSWLKASAFGKINYDGLKHNSFYLGLVQPSGG
jgi:hypothetical protein